MKFSGLKTGFTFLLISILLSLTIVGSLFFTMLAENIGGTIDSAFHFGNVTGTTFYTCTTLVVAGFLFYLYTFFRNKESAVWALLIFFIVLIIFLNAAIFYFKIRFPDSHIDGQQSFDAIAIPIKTSWLYVVIGLAHDIAMNRRTQKNKS